MIILVSDIYLKVDTTLYHIIWNHYIHPTDANMRLSAYLEPNHVTLIVA